MYADTVVYIREVANRVSQFCKMEYPVTLPNMLEYLHKLNGELVEVDALDVDMEGIAAKRDSDSFMIRLPKGMSDERKVVYIAKGIGNAFLHLRFPGPTEKNDHYLMLSNGLFYNLGTNAYIQAAEFAHTLLRDGKSHYPETI